jgi:cell division protein FtsB
MTTKSIRKLIYIMTLLLILISIVAHIVQDQRMADSDRRLARQITELQAENAELHRRILGLEEQVSWDKLYQDALFADFMDALAPCEPEQTKSSRDGERPAYNLTPSERDMVESVVMAEAGGEPYEGQMLVTQCISNACKIDGIRPAEAVKKYAYAKSRPEPSDSVIKAVSAVFDKGEKVVDEPIVYFYAPDRVKSEFHETQRYICQVGGHRFFAEAN